MNEIVRATMPESLAELAAIQRSSAIRARNAEIVDLCATRSENWTFSFTQETPLSDFRQAATVATLLDEREECSAENLDRVTFRPAPFKHDGAWLIEVVFRVPKPWPWASKEWYVSEEALFHAWEAAGSQ
jgi:hypothetical protein